MGEKQRTEQSDQSWRSERHRLQDGQARVSGSAQGSSGRGRPAPGRGLKRCVGHCPQGPRGVTLVARGTRMRLVVWDFRLDWSLLYGPREPHPSPAVRPNAPLTQIGRRAAFLSEPPAASSLRPRKLGVDFLKDSHSAGGRCRHLV